MTLSCYEADEAAQARLLAIFRGWDAVRGTETCPHCNASGLAPSSDERTECGFCEGDDR